MKRTVPWFLAVSRTVNGFVLGVMDTGGFVAACGLHSPFRLVRHNMLISVGLFCRNLRRCDVFSVLNSPMSVVDDYCHT
jgi:hypothetical protein